MQLWRSFTPSHLQSRKSFCMRGWALFVLLSVTCCSSFVQAADDECQPELIIRDKSPGKPKPPGTKTPGKKFDRASPEVDSLLKNLDTLALGFKITPTDYGYSEGSDIYRFNGYGAKPDSFCMENERCFKQLAPVPEKNIAFAISGSADIFRIDLKAGRRDTLKVLPLSSMSLSDENGQALEPIKRGQIHGIAYDSKRKRVLLICAYGDGREKLLSFSSDGNELRLVSILPVAEERICLCYESTGDRIYTVAGGFQPRRIEEFTSEGKPVSITEFQIAIEVGTMPKNGAQLFVREGKAIVFAPHVDKGSALSPGTKPAQVYVYQLGSGELLFKKGLTGVQI